MFQLYHELVFLGQHFQAQGIALLALKGPLLSQKLFQDITARSSKDLDLLVAYTALAPAKKLLESLGYYCLDAPQKYQSKEAKRCFHDLGFYHDEKQVNVELHWQLFEGHVIDEDLNLHVETSAIANVNVLSSSSDFLYLIIHVAKHKWFREKWLVDLIKYIALEGESLVFEVLKTAEGTSYEHLVLDTLLLLKRNYGVSCIPELQHRSPTNQKRFLKEVSAIQARAAVNTKTLKGLKKLKFRLIRWREDYIISPDMWWRNIKFTFVYAQLYKVPRWWGVFRTAVAPFYYIFQLKK